MDKLGTLKILGTAIRSIRIEKKLSQAKLGLKIYKDQQSIHKVEVGLFNPTYVYLLEICEGLDIKLEDLAKKIESLKAIKN